MALVAEEKEKAGARALVALVAQEKEAARVRAKVAAATSVAVTAGGNYN